MDARPSALLFPRPRGCPVGCSRRTRATAQPSYRSLLLSSVLRHAGDAVIAGCEKSPAQTRVPFDAHTHRPGEPEVLDYRLLGHLPAFRVYDERRAGRDVQLQLSPAFQVSLESLRV